MDRTALKIVDLIRDTSSSLPDDAERALRKALKSEVRGSSAALNLGVILDNVALARAKGTPLCQDTGTLTFFVDDTLRRRVTPKRIADAVAEATKRGYLRRNTFDSLTGASYDDNVCEGAPVVHYVARGDGSVSLLMKGGGSENMSRQYSLPDSALGAGRDIAGVRLCLLDAIRAAQGYGCAPGILGVCVGGDRAVGYETAKEQLFRSLDASGASGDPRLAALERRILREANTLGIGPMGLGGRTTLLGVRIASRPRVPASFFVTVAYLCWAARRRTVIL